MNREQFYAKLMPFDEERLRKVLWNLYWRGSAQLRKRIEGEMEPAERDRRRRSPAEPPDPGAVLDEVRDFVQLARSGAYIAGDRRVSPAERTRWRVTFRWLATDAQSALRAEDADPAEEALSLIIDLAREMGDYNYFRSEDPVEAARFVVSDAASALWQSMRSRHGFRIFAERAAAQLVKWESRYGWTRGWGQLGDKETTLASVLARMLPAPDMWTAFADCYLDALDEVAPATTAKAKSREYSDAGAFCRRRTDALAEWHELLLGSLAGSDVEDRLDRLTRHPALAGPELTFLQARLAYHRGDLERARTLAHDCLEELPGHHYFAGFAAEIGAEFPPRAREIADEVARREAAQATAGGPG